MSATPTGVTSRAGFVLAGGGSTRMGRDKALLPYGDSTLIEHIAKIVKQAAGNVTIVAPPGRYESLGYPIISDLVEGKGPLGGVFTALSSTKAVWNLIVACDMPSVNLDLLETLFLMSEGTTLDAVVPETNAGFEPLCAIYHRRCLVQAATSLDHNVLKMQDFLSTVGVEPYLVSDLDPLENINTPEQLRYSRAAENAPENSLEPAITTNGSGQAAHYIEFRNVYKTFDRPVLVDVNFHLLAGETLAIIGRSGVGKSVTLGHIMGFLKPDSGRVTVSYTDITDFTEAEMRRIRKKVTMVFQSGALFDSLTVGENILFSLELRDDYDEKNKEDVVNGLLQMVDLLEFKDYYPSDLSTGYKRAVAIARALAAQPECILYDEPTTMVDPIMSDHLTNLMLRLKNQLQLTGVIVTHDLELMRNVADKVVVLFEGHAIYFGPVAGLEKSEHPHIIEFLAMDRV